MPRARARHREVSAAYVDPGVLEPCASSTVADHGLTKLRRPEASCADTKVYYTYSRAVHVGPEEGRVEPEEARSLIRRGRFCVFADPLAAMLDDALGPARAILVGQSEKGRVLLVVFIEQSEDTIRIISARRATSRERKRYEEGDW